MRDYAGGVPVPGMIDTYPVPQVERVVYTTASNIKHCWAWMLLWRRSRKICAVWILSAQFCPRSLRTWRLSPFSVCQIAAGEPVVRCVAPWHRLDIQVPADLAEEVARIIGYEDIATTLIKRCVAARAQ